MQSLEFYFDSKKIFYIFAPLMKTL